MAALLFVYDYLDQSACRGDEHAASASICITKTPGAWLNLSRIIERVLLLEHLALTKNVLRQVLTLKRPNFNILVNSGLPHVDLGAAHEQFTTARIEARRAELCRLFHCVSDRLNLLEASVPHANSPVSGNGHNLLLLIVDVDLQNLALVMSLDALDYTLSIRINEQELSFGTASREQAQLLRNREVSNVGMILLFAIVIIVVRLVLLRVVERVKELDGSIESTRNQTYVANVTHCSNAHLLPLVSRRSLRLISATTLMRNWSLHAHLLLTRNRFDRLRLLRLGVIKCRSQLPLLLTLDDHLAVLLDAIKIKCRSISIN